MSKDYDYELGYLLGLLSSLTMITFGGFFLRTVDKKVLCIFCIIFGILTLSIIEIQKRKEKKQRGDSINGR